MERDVVYQYIDFEREHQDKKYGVDKPQSLPGFLLVLQREVQEAIDGWMNGVYEGRDAPLHEVVQVAATAVACLEKYGTRGTALATNDISQDPHLV